MVTGQRGVKYPRACGQCRIQRFVGKSAQPQQEAIADTGRLGFQRLVTAHAALGFVIPLGIMLST
ncbi:hypothetical protein D3C77_756420 [compost metagenome]